MKEISNSDEIKISVIVCCYRGEATIEKCLRSLDNQSYNGNFFEVILVNDGAIDNTEQQIQDYIERRLTKAPRILYYKKQNEGLSVARNFGIERSKGEIITFIDEDAIADRDFLLNVVAQFSSKPHINCLGGIVEIANREDKFASLFHHSIFNWQMENFEAIIGTNMSFRRGFLLQANGFQPEFNKRGDELALFWKTKKYLRKHISNKVRVRHYQPNNWKHFIKTRFENGYFTAAVDSLAVHYSNRSIYYVYQRLLAYVTFLALPFLIIPLVFVSTTFATLVAVIYAIICTKRYLLDGGLIGPFRSLLKSSKAQGYLDYLFLFYLIFRANWIQDRGYVLGFIDFRKTNWSHKQLNLE